MYSVRKRDVVLCGIPRFLGTRYDSQRLKAPCHVLSTRLSLTNVLNSAADACTHSQVHKVVKKLHLDLDVRTLDLLGERMNYQHIYPNLRSMQALPDSDDVMNSFTAVERKRFRSEYDDVALINVSSVHVSCLARSRVTPSRSSTTNYSQP